MPETILRIVGFIALYGIVFLLTMGLNARQLAETGSEANAILNAAIIALPVTFVAWLVYWKTRPAKGGPRPPRPPAPPFFPF